MSAFVLGLLFGMATGFPIGVQTFVMMNQGLAAGYPRVLYGIVTASCCDNLLILLGASGASVALAAPGSREILICVGAAFLIVMGLLALRSTPEDAEVQGFVRPVAMVAQAAGVSLLNPHAIFVTVGVLGAAIAAQNAGNRTEFAAGVISSSWVWFLMVGLGAAILQRWLTGTARLWIGRVSGVTMLALAGLLGLELM